MPFEKGNTINLGKKLSLETRTKMSTWHKAHPSEPKTWFKKRNIPWNNRGSVALNAYFAGLVDGEGSIFMTNNGAKTGYNKDGRYKKVCVAISMRADKAQPLPEGQSIWGGSIHIRKPRKSFINEALDWRLWTKNAERFLISIKPFLRIKDKQADLALRYRSLQTRRHPGTIKRVISDDEMKYREEIESELRRLNE